MKNSFDMLLHSFLIVVVVAAFPLNELFAQCYMITSDKYNQFLIEIGFPTIPARQGPMTKDECEYALEQMDNRQKDGSHCECEQTNTTESYNTQGQNKSRIQIEDHQTQLKKLRALAQQKELEKKNADRQIVEQKKLDLLRKLKRIKSLDQLKTTSDLSVKGEQNLNNNQIEEGRDNSESAFADGKIDPNNNSLPDNNITISPPAIIEHQQTLYEYIDEQKEVVRTKITNVQKEKAEIQEKKNQHQEKIKMQTIGIKRLTTEKFMAKEESQKEEIDSLLMLAEQLLEESIEQNEQADRELVEKNKVLQESEALLNKYEDTYNKSKEHPEESDQLLKELRGDK